MVDFVSDINRALQNHHPRNFLPLASRRAFSLQRKCDGKKFLG